ncbi:ribonuclease III [Lachnoclostridium phytofermentans]|uniref:Ribonuclease 3 n=1 Tax=Lachnoclostridium phytofermentans (strain ATCC 700394 / DSM 18823 / ISDg) TaxID=357809 RepID=A9KLR1_LACP7|nr:ribonuclease III [Lachnoclostridium phytofermentans]ABX42805.1 Ribonuclease III [Lachnoclostridium phytofermentans ISDg]
MAELSTKKLLAEFEQKIDYAFTEPGLLRQALTHSSFANEKRLSKLANNERLEFLGDAVLELTTSEWLFEKHPKMPEGDLTKLRASMVCEQTLALCARELHLGNYVFLGKGEDTTGGRDRDSILSDALESIIGAIYLDGGFANAKEFISNYILSDIEHKKLFYDSKTILQEIVQSEYKKHLSYELLQETGPDHNKKFTVVAKMDEESLEIGTGRTKKAAEQEAAYRSILQLRKLLK